MRGSVEFGAVCSAGGLLLAPLATGAAAGQTLSDEHRDGHALARSSLKHDRRQCSSVYFFTQPANVSS